MFLYAVFQGERLVIGGVMGLAALGSYAITAQLALLPVLIAGRLSLGLGLPVIARSGADTARGIEIRQNVMQVFGLAGMLFWLGFVTLAPFLTARLFGHAYLQDSAIVSWIAAAAALRLQKTGPTTLLLASNRARDIMAGNSARVVGLGVGTLGMILTRDLTVFTAAAAGGEAVSCAIAAYRAFPGPGAILLPLPLLVMAAVQAIWPFSLDAAVPLGIVLAAASLFLLVRMAGRHLRAPRATLQRAGA